MPPLHIGVIPPCTIVAVLAQNLKRPQSGLAGGRVNSTRIWNEWIEEDKLIDLVIVRERKRQVPTEPPYSR